MSRELFGTDGVRGSAGAYPLDAEGSMRIGMAVGTHFAEPGELVLVGHDPRESSPHLAAGLATGLTATGVNVEIIGTIPTPGLAYITRENDAAAGVMITASHNKYTDNGIKVFNRNGDKLSDSTEAALNAMIANGVTPRGFGAWRTAPGLISEYENFLVSSADTDELEGLTIGLDTGNGAASGIAQRVFERLGAYVVPMFDKPDGRNINAQCGATHPEALRQAVLERGLDMGAAFDGDADRIIMIDEEGRDFTGDHIMYTLAKANGHEGAVATVMTNLGTELAMREAGIDLVREDVGDRYVLRGLRETGYRLGGEQSGHIIMPELLATGDGMLAAVQAMRAVRRSGQSLGAWRDEVKLLPQSLVNIPVTNKRLLEHDDVQAYVREITDGLGGDGRVLIRPSGTEPLARVMVEAPNAPWAAQNAANGLQQILTRLSA